MLSNWGEARKYMNAQQGVTTLEPAYPLALSRCSDHSALFFSEADFELVHSDLSCHLF